MRKTIAFLATTTFAIPLLAATPAPKTAAMLVKDPFPNGCVDCHSNKKDMPVPLSTGLKEWTTKVDRALLAKSQAAAPKGMSLKGKHPNVTAMVKEIPSGCLKCHAKDSKMAPPFATLMHAIHFSGVEANRFVTTFNGECTVCHKLNTTSGQWSLANGAEK